MMTTKKIRRKKTEEARKENLKCEIRDLIEKAKDIISSCLGFDHIEFSDVLVNEGIFYDQILKDKNIAKEKWAKALTIITTTFGPDHPKYIHVSNLLANT
eukprot:TRINITY_DN2516_c1_g1_i1.p1 TRINITY_DN2516_c1_g1~~TRINITY_DN2516_c1_g1_i1.p1  ORF type:complete len:100 (-),score=18.60 TRINITY_DN2516_c1_g1_i1:195-494(-)